MEEIRNYSVKAADDIFIFDVDETLIVYGTLLNGEFQKMNNLSANLAAQLGEEMAVLLNFLLYDKLHFDDILRYDKTSTCCTDWPEVVQEIYTHSVDHGKFLSDLYANALIAYNSQFSDIFSSEILAGLSKCVSTTNEITGGFITAGRRMVQEALNRPNAEVYVVSAGMLLPTLVKLKCYGIDGISPGNIFSSRLAPRGKLSCILSILKRHPNVKPTNVYVVGDGLEELLCASLLQLSFCKIRSKIDVLYFTAALANPRRNPVDELMEPMSPEDSPTPRDRRSTSPELTLSYLRSVDTNECTVSRASDSIEPISPLSSHRLPCLADYTAPEVKTLERHPQAPDINIWPMLKSVNPDAYQQLAVHYLMIEQSNQEKEKQKTYSVEVEQ